MIKNIFYSLLVTASFFVFMNLVSAISVSQTVYVDANATGTGDGTSLVDAFTTIQAAINAPTTVDGDIILIADGTYTLSSTLEVSKELTIQGTTQSGTIINVSGASAYGIHSNKSNIHFKDFTVHSGNGVRAFKIEGLTLNSPEGTQNGVKATNVTLSNVTIDGFGGTSKTNIDINGVDNAVLTNVISNNAGSGNGFSLTDGNNLTLTNVTTSGNAWGGVALYTYGRYYPGGISGVTITGQNSSETNPLYNQEIGTYNAGGAFLTTGISASQFTYKGISTASPGYVLYNEDITELYNALGANSSAVKIIEISTGYTIVAPGQTIQSRIDGATAGDTIVAPAGSYTENLTINKALTLKGANADVSAVTGTRGSESVVTGKILITAGDVTLKGFKVTNPSYATAATIHGIQVFGNGPTISNINLSNNIVSDINNPNTPVKGAYGIMVQADVNNVTIDSNKIDTITSAGWARGIEITPSCGVTGIPQGVTITKNSVTNIVDTAGDDSYIVSVDWCSSVPRIADASQVNLTGNSFDITKLKNLDTGHELNATKNWWGSASPNFSAFPSFSKFEPWCIVADCSTLFSLPGAGDWASTSSTGGSSVASTTATSTASTTPITSTTTQVLQQQTGTTTEQVLGVSTFNFTRNLSFGMRGDDVSELQRFLIAKGYLKLRTGLPTGWFGPLTRAALIKWQLENKIRAEGYFGPISRNLLNPKN